MKRELRLSIIMNIVLQLVTIGSGLILPHLFIGSYGSEINGMVASITQFLSYITLLESGIGGVIKAELYKPLLSKDENELGKIVNAVDRFYKKIGAAFVLYIFIIAVSFHRISNSQFDWMFSASLVVVLGISSLVQYFYGITYQMLLQADQKYWLTSCTQIITMIINVLLSGVLIKQGASIHAVKLMTALVFCLRPLVFNVYVKTHYDINWNECPDENTLSQRWDGFGHHIAYFIHSNTDMVLLTLFSTLAEVSVYSIYLMVVTGIRSLVNAISSAIEPYVGRKIAENNEGLDRVFYTYEFINYYVISVLFTVTALMIIPFVSLYTMNVSDANYIRPAFAFILVAAEGIYCMRSPYSVLIFSAGHFRQTKIGAFIEAGINIVVSILLIKPLGIIGVASGTLVAMIYRTTQYANYLSRNIVYYEMKVYGRRIIAVAISVCLSAFSYNALEKMIGLTIVNYMEWACLSICAFAMSLAVASIVFYALFPREFRNVVRMFNRRIDIKE